MPELHCILALTPCLVPVASHFLQSEIILLLLAFAHLSCKIKLILKSINFDDFLISFKPDFAQSQVFKKTLQISRSLY